LQMGTLWADSADGPPRIESLPNEGTGG